jgi:hypothetical protein
MGSARQIVNDSTRGAKSGNRFADVRNNTRACFGLLRRNVRQTTMKLSRARKREMKRRRRRNESETADDGWVEFGGQAIWAVGFTEGGAPYGLTREEFDAPARSTRDEFDALDDEGDDDFGRQPKWYDVKRWLPSGCSTYRRACA